MIREQVFYPGHDSWLHIRWSYSFQAQIFAGEFYPRWLVDFDHGAGSIAMLLYPPVPYLMSFPLYPLFPGEDLFYLRMNLGNMLCLVFSFASMYFLHLSLLVLSIDWCHYWRLYSIYLNLICI